MYCLPIETSTLRALNYRNYGIFLIMGNAGFKPSTVAGRLRCLGGTSLKGVKYRKSRA